MRKRTVRTGLRLMAAGIISVMAATFFHDGLSRLLFLDAAHEALVTSLGFFFGGICGGCGVLVAAAGLLQSDPDEAGIRLIPTVMFLFSLVVLFFVLVYNSISVPQSPKMQQGDSIDI